MSKGISELQETILTICLKEKFLTSQEILHQVFSGCEYETGHASLSRSLARLWEKDLIIIWKTLTRYRTGISLTPTGKALASTIKAEAEKSG